MCFSITQFSSLPLWQVLKCHIPDKSLPPRHLDLLAGPSRSLWVETAPFSSLCPECPGSRRWSASSGWPWASRAPPGPWVWWEWCGPGRGWHLFCLAPKRGRWTRQISAAWIFSSLCRCFPVMETIVVCCYKCLVTVSRTWSCQFYVILNLLQGFI